MKCVDEAEEEVAPALVSKRESAGFSLKSDVFSGKMPTLVDVIILGNGNPTAKTKSKCLAADRKPDKTK